MSDLADALRDGKVALLSTDTVYGLAALPGSPGYDEIFRLKQRHAAQVLPWIVGGVEDLCSYGECVPEYAVALAKAFWPGALTLVVRASEKAMALGCVAEDGTVALRCPDDPSCLALLRALDAPLACTSANIHGEPAPSRIEEISPVFLQLPHMRDLSPCCKGGMSSMIVDCTEAAPRILRHGSINQQLVEAVANLDDRLF